MTMSPPSPPSSSPGLGRAGAGVTGGTVAGGVVTTVPVRTEKIIAPAANIRTAARNPRPTISAILRRPLAAGRAQTTATGGSGVVTAVGGDAGSGAAAPLRSDPRPSPLELATASARASSPLDGTPLPC